mgnify:CR=1 FL=1
MKQRYIFVITSGWVLTGYQDSYSPTNEISIGEASCIRRWGTTNGLGQLATQGPTDETKLEFCGSVAINKKHLLFSIKCTGWS